MNNDEQHEKFSAGALPVRTKQQNHIAKRIASIRCVNPDEKILYHYQRAHELTFDDGSKMEVCEDHWRRPGVELKAGNYVVKVGPGNFSFLSPDEMKERYEQV